MQGWKKDYSRYKSLFLNVWVYYNTKPNLRIYLELILSLGTIIIFSIFAIRPTVLTILDIYNQIGVKKEIVSKLDQKIKNLQSANRLMQSNSESLVLVDQSVPNESQVEKVIKQIEQIALSNALNIKSISVTDVDIVGKKDKKDFSENTKFPTNADSIQISFSVSGSYENITNFLSKIESSRRPFRVDSLIINTSKVDESTEKIINLTISSRLPYTYVSSENIK